MEPPSVCLSLNQSIRLGSLEAQVLRIIRQLDTNNSVTSGCQVSTTRHPSEVQVESVRDRQRSPGSKVFIGRSFANSTVKLPCDLGDAGASVKFVLTTRNQMKNQTVFAASSFSCSQSPHYDGTQDNGNFVPSHLLVYHECGIFRCTPPFATAGGDGGSVEQFKRNEQS